MSLLTMNSAITIPLVIIVLTTVFFFYHYSRSEQSRQAAAVRARGFKPNRIRTVHIHFYHASEGGTAEHLAKTHAQICLQSIARSWNQKHPKLPISLTACIRPMKDIDIYTEELDLTLFSCNGEHVLNCFLVSTYQQGPFAESVQPVVDWIDEQVNDFRVSRQFLAEMHFCVFGCGNSSYVASYNTAALRIASQLLQLGASMFAPIYMGDEENASGDGLDHDFVQFMESHITRVVHAIATSAEMNAFLAVEQAKTALFNASVLSVPATNGAATQGEGDFSDSGSGSDDDDGDENTEGGNAGALDENMVDLEDLARGRKQPTARQSSSAPPPRKGMITEPLRASLTKQGYKLVGTHSAVKLCRWTKAALRSRGHCYKHTFYGIQSHLCMEATPNLACANKCVFCWRQHSNPVGTEWRWLMDDAVEIVDGCVRSHVKMILEARGIPGVQPERFVEAQTVRHCALSLVGEPVMYPKISEFVDELHRRGISSYVVTNAQFPDAIRSLVPVTQLYVSIDAATESDLKRIDRPLFKDFWFRFHDSLAALTESRQRSVYRLTLVHGFNTAELDGYAKLIIQHQPHIVEVKGVTFCGTGQEKTSKLKEEDILTMKNVPWHEEVVEFCQQLVSRLGDGYAIASEHEHSNCILIAHKSFLIGGKWHTWIDYPRFQQLYQHYKQTGQRFTAHDYMAETPHWAAFGSPHRGFDPAHTRFRRKATLVQGPEN